MNPGKILIDLVGSYQDRMMKKDTLQRHVEIMKYMNKKYGESHVFTCLDLVNKINMNKIIKNRVNDESQIEILADLALAIELVADPHQLSLDAEYKLGLISFVDKMYSKVLEPIMYASVGIMQGSEYKANLPIYKCRRFFYSENMVDLRGLIKGHTLNECDSLKDSLLKFRFS